VIIFTDIVKVVEIDETALVDIPICKGCANNKQKANEKEGPLHDRGMSQL
jgi:hypothetical protein